MPESAARQTPFCGYTVAGAACFCLVLAFSVHYAFGVFFKPVSSEFGWTRAMTAGAFSLVWISQGVLAFVGAGLGGTFVPLTSTTARWFVARRGRTTGNSVLLP